MRAQLSVLVPTVPNTEGLVGAMAIFQVESYVRSPWKKAGIQPRYRLGEYFALMNGTQTQNGYIISDRQLLTYMRYMCYYGSTEDGVTPPNLVTPMYNQGIYTFIPKAATLVIQPAPEVGSYAVILAGLIFNQWMSPPTNFEYI